MTIANPTNTPPRPPKTVEFAPRLAIIGCGAIADAYHLPGLAKCPDIMDQLILVDNNSSRLAELSARFDVAHGVNDYREILDQVDGVIVATPPHTHHSICMEFLSHGIHVLCEKPLANTVGELRQMTNEAAANDALVCVNHTRRLFPTNQAVGRLISDGKLGRLQKITYTDGGQFTWPTVSGFHFQKGARGVLFDKGIHSLDLICWWLGTKPRVIRAETDSFGGPESLASIEFEHDGCAIDLKLSWLTKLPNRFRVAGELATIEGSIEDWGALTFTRRTGQRQKMKFKARQTQYCDFGETMLANFIGAVRGQARPEVPATDVVHSLELIEECYETATRLELPWLKNLATLGE